MDRYEAARTLGVADADVKKLESREDGLVVTLGDGTTRLLHEDGWSTYQAGDDVPVREKPEDVDGDEQDPTEEPVDETDKTDEGDKDTDKETEEPVDELDPDAEYEQNEVRDQAVEEVPDGNAQDVLVWVGDDKERAQRALEHEREKPVPRKRLVSELEKRSEG